MRSIDGSHQASDMSGMSDKFAISAGGREMPDIHSSTEAYARRFAGSVGKYFLDIQADQAMSLISSCQSGRILDVGGGHGQLLPYLLDKGYDVTVLGSDSSCFSGLIDSRSTGRCRCVAGDIMNPPFSDDSFDVVIAFRMLAHIYNWHEFIHNLCRVACKLVMVDFPTILSMNAVTPLFFSLKRKVEGNTRPYQLYSHKQISSCFCDAGMTRINSMAQFFWPMALHRSIGCPRLSQIMEYVPRVIRLTQWFGSPVILCAAGEDSRQ